MKKRKELTDEDLKKYVSGGVITELTESSNNKKYTLWDDKDGHYRGECKSLDAAQKLAQSKDISDEIIDYSELWRIQRRARNN